MFFFGWFKGLLGKLSDALDSRPREASIDIITAITRSKKADVERYFDDFVNAIHKAEKWGEGKTGDEKKAYAMELLGDVAGILGKWVTNIALEVILPYALSMLGKWIYAKAGKR